MRKSRRGDGGEQTSISSMEKERDGIIHGRAERAKDDGAAGGSGETGRAVEGEELGRELEERNGLESERQGEGEGAGAKLQGVAGLEGARGRGVGLEGEGMGDGADLGEGGGDELVVESVVAGRRGEQLGEGRQEGGVLALAGGGEGPEDVEGLDVTAALPDGVEGRGTVEAGQHVAGVV